MVRLVRSYPLGELLRTQQTARRPNVTESAYMLLMYTKLQ